MYKFEKVVMGIYEKALPKKASWSTKIDTAKEAGYDFIEISVDESDERLSRLDWKKEEIKDMKNLLIDKDFRIPSMTFSGQKRYPMGSMDNSIREKSMDLMKKAIDLSDKLGIRVIQVTGYDVYYEERSDKTREMFIQNLKKACEWASKACITLAIENMENTFLNSVTKYMEIAKEVDSPWLKLYPDLGNLTAWTHEKVYEELEKGIKEQQIIAVHLKEAKKVTDTFGGVFRELEFGTGDVDFVKTFETLKRAEFKGPFLVEMWNESSKTPLEDIKKVREWMLLRMKEGGFI
jgi:L-ribulose-5-phosphate 3-epimerase